jgi:hypothetical protein
VVVLLFRNDNWMGVVAAVHDAMADMGDVLPVFLGEMV